MMEIAEETDENKDIVGRETSPMPKTKKNDRAKLLSKSPKLVISDRFLARQKAMQGRGQSQSEKDINGEHNDVIMVG